ncbi:uncharacterized protein LOC112041818, partial [Lingula anatina]|uniref:Uncharacterized protein LOC112041818 n=1 Tax=Lingula anatina TaxID=7574 RepID=A0A2R2MM12_LINAN
MSTAKKKATMPVGDKKGGDGASDSSKRPRSKSPNKLKKRKDGGTPEKSQTPNPDEASEDSGPAQTKNVITGADVLSLAIKEDDLLKLREPHPPETKKTPVTQPVVVRKRKPQSELDKPTPRVVTVARPAPPNAPIKPVDT